MSLLTLGGILVGCAVWHTCWTLGDLRDDQELRESGVIFGAAAAGLSVGAAAFVFPPVGPFGTVPTTDIVFQWAALQALPALFVTLGGLLVFEYQIWSRYRDFEGLLLGVEPPAHDGGDA